MARKKLQEPAQAPPAPAERKPPTRATVAEVVARFEGEQANAREQMAEWRDMLAGRLGRLYEHGVERSFDTTVERIVFHGARQECLGDAIGWLQGEPPAHDPTPAGRIRLALACVRMEMSGMIRRRDWEPAGQCPIWNGVRADSAASRLQAWERISEALEKMLDPAWFELVDDEVQPTAGEVAS